MIILFEITSHRTTNAHEVLKKSMNSGSSSLACFSDRNATTFAAVVLANSQDEERKSLRSSSIDGISGKDGVDDDDVLLWEYDVADVRDAVVVLGTRRFDSSGL